MRNPQSVRSFEYKNEYLYVVIREVPESGPDTYVHCCGINLSRFKPLRWQKAGICSNPAVRGLQLLRIDVSAYVLKQGAKTRKTDISCAPMSPSVVMNLFAPAFLRVFVASCETGLLEAFFWFMYVQLILI